MEGSRLGRVAAVPAIEESNDSANCSRRPRAAFPVVTQNPFPIRFLYLSTVIANDFYHNHTCLSLNSDRARNSQHNPELCASHRAMSLGGITPLWSLVCAGIRSCRRLSASKYLPQCTPAYIRASRIGSCRVPGCGNHPSDQRRKSTA